MAAFDARLAELSEDGLLALMGSKNLEPRDLDHITLEFVEEVWLLRTAWDVESVGLDSRARTVS